MADNIAKTKKKIKIDTTTVKIIGHNKIDPSTNFELLLPSSMQLRKPSAYHKTKCTNLQEKSVVTKYAVDNMKARDQAVHKFLGKKSAETEFLTTKLEEYPLPRNMGPVVPPIDRRLDDVN